MNTRTLIDNIKQGDALKSNNTFNSIMQDKLISALDSHKQVVASQMYGASNDTPETEMDGETTADANV
jgi:hypothetical protein